MRPVPGPGSGSTGLFIRRAIVIGCAALICAGMLGGSKGGRGGKGAPPPPAGGAGGKGGVAGSNLPLFASLEDFLLPGTQPEPSFLNFYPVLSATECSLCHGLFDAAGYNPDAEPYRNWVSSMMGQATRDPIFFACLTIANQDMNKAGDLCLRCHTPAAWLAGRSNPTDGSVLGGGVGADFDGVNCHFCHRLVDPVYVPGQSPSVDVGILDELDKLGLLPQPGQLHSGTYVVDPDSVRRGPRDPAVFPSNPHGEPWYLSPFHLSSDLCATCHDVSNPAFMRQPNGSYVLTEPNAAHPTQNKYDMFPVERTYSEWSASQFAKGGVQMNGLFGGNHPTGVMQTCQDCHMPKHTAPGCIVQDFPIWPDMAQHAFSGANSWVLRAVYHMYPFESGLNPTWVDQSVARNVQMLRDASTMTLSQQGSNLNVRVTNYSGHKLPTGYPEGRRMWINVRFFNASDQLIAERGAYDGQTALLNTTDTKVYEGKLGLDEYMAGVSGLPAGESFHFVLNNVFLKDNRIPPMGFTNAGFAAVQAAPVAYSYADGQHWDDTPYAIPSGAAKAVVTLYHQTTTKEYIEFLRDANITDDRGQIAYDMWEMFGKSAPVDMNSAMIVLTSPLIGDLNNDSVVNGLDLGILLINWSIPPGSPGCGGAMPCAPDLNGDGQVNGLDLGILLGNWTI